MRSKLLSKREVAEGTIEFAFEKPVGFAQIAGQTIDITLIDPPETDNEGNSRTFSIVSSPKDAKLKIATRMRETAFKRVLNNMPFGSEIVVDGPYGSFFLHESTERPAVFLAGGIGVTPFHAIIADATVRALPHKLFLFYSNRRPEDAPYLDEFESLEKTNVNLVFVPTMTAMGRSQQAWRGETGKIDAILLARHLPSNTTPIYYLAGPQAMVTAMRNMLSSSGVGTDDIRFEEFTGY